MKASRAGSSLPWCACQQARRRATSGRSCSAACRLFLQLMPSLAKKCQTAK